MLTIHWISLRMRVRVSFKSNTKGLSLSMITKLYLIEMGEWEKENDGNKYLLNVIDVFSKFAWSEPIKSKNAKSVLEAFKKIIKESGRKPEKLWVDQGSEFYNRDFKKFLKENDIEMYSTHGDHKSAVVERFNRTLKEMMWKYFTSQNTRKYVNVLNDFLDLYNNKKHSTIKMSPKEASDPENTLIVYNNVNQDPGEFKKPKYKVGDWVRISRIKGTFEKGYLPNFSREIFKIREVKNSIPTTYYLDEYDGTPIEGAFYEKELLKTKFTDTFEVEEVLKTRTVKGKKQEFVKWLGWPDKYNEWVDV